MANIFVLALAAAVYPTLLAGVIVILTRPNPAGQLVAFLLGGMTVSIAAGLLILAAMAGSGQLDRSSQAASPGIDIALGLLSLAVACVVATGRPRRLAEAGMRRRRPREPARPSRTREVLGRGSLPLTVALGAALNLPGVWYLAALKDISVSDYSTAKEIALVVAFNLIMFLLVEVPLLAYLLSPDRSRAAVDGFNAWVRANKRRLAVWIATAVGLYLMIKGIAGAVS